MAQEVHTECQAYENGDPQNEVISDAAYSPSIVEIGFIDDLPSDASETSVSEDEKPQQEVTQESAIHSAKPNEEPQDQITNASSNHHVPQDSVPSQLDSPAKHSYQNVDCDDTDFLQEASQVTDAQDEEGEDEEKSSLQNGEEIGLANHTLEESMLMLQLSLEEKTALGPFEKLSKRREDKSMEIAKAAENAPKNRYKDVLPYDESRVQLSESESGDYVNASFMKMEIPSMETTNEYIATQGPLPNTCDDFWQMVWEQKCGIIVMVTTLKERNRSKCHKYWPDLNETVIYADIQMSCFSETVTQASIMRDLLLVNEKKNEDRHVIHVQYLAWPDHGVPDDATDFLEFVQQLREWRKLIDGNVAVHCSAGVGRTGVLILMETVMCLVETGCPVFPLELVRIMRDQRVMMVQTVGQYKFICEAILKFYNDHQSKFVTSDEL